MAIAGFIFSLFLVLVTFWAWPGFDSYQVEMVSRQKPGPTQAASMDADPVDRDPAQQPENLNEENP